MGLSATLAELQRDLEANQDQRRRYERWKALMESRDISVETAEWDATRACGCLSCPVCRPDVATLAEQLGVPFLNLLMALYAAEESVLSRARERLTPEANRAARRRAKRR